MADNGDKHSEDEARRIIERVSRESGEPGFVERTARRTQDHLTAADADQHDAIEKWGTRIGRVIAVVVTVVIIAWGVAYLAS